MKKKCFWVSWQMETRLPKEPRQIQRVQVEGSNRWYQVWTHEFKQDHVGELIVKGWAALFFKVKFEDVKVIRMSAFDR